jgi:hypothetical protein
MIGRAKNSQLETYTKDEGATFIGSSDFPLALVASVKRWDPRGLLFGTGEIPTEASPDEQARLRSLLDGTIKNKRALICSGGDDKLVPYRASRPLVEFLAAATGKGGWYEDGGVYLENNVYNGVGHKFSDGMVKDSIRFVSDTLAGVSNVGTGRTSKI